MKASEFLNENLLGIMEETLNLIDSSLCPESYFWYGLLYQAREQKLKAFEYYCNIFSEEHRFTETIINHTNGLLKGLLNDLSSERT